VKEVGFKPGVKQRCRLVIDVQSGESEEVEVKIMFPTECVVHSFKS